MPAEPTVEPLPPAAVPELTRLAAQSGLPLPEVFRRVCEVAADTVQVERVGVWLIVDEGCVLRCVNLFERSKRRHSKGNSLAQASCPNFFDSFHSDPVIAAEAARFDPRTADLREPYLIPHGIASLLVAPFARAGRVVGMVCHEHMGPPRQWSEQERRFARAAAYLLADRMAAAECALRTSMPDVPCGVRPNNPPACSIPLPHAVAHDLHDLLTDIIADTEWIARVPNLPEGVRSRLKRIANAARDGVALVRTPTETMAAAEPGTDIHECLSYPASDNDTGEYERLPTAP